MQKKLNSIIISYTCAAAITLFNLQIFAMQQWFMYISTFIYIYMHIIYVVSFILFFGANLLSCFLLLFVLLLESDGCAAVLGD